MARMVGKGAKQAAARGAHLVAFPEMVLTGYPVEDLALRASFIEASRAALAELATDLVWSRSASFSRPGARAGMWLAGVSNLGMAAGFGWLARRRG